MTRNSGPIVGVDAARGVSSIMRRFRLIAVLMMPGMLAGCLGPDVVATAGLSAAQAGVSEFYKGRLRTAWEVQLETLFQVVHSSLRRLGYTIEGERAEGKEWFIASREADGTAIEVYLRRSTAKVTRVSIRVGFFGDQPLSRLIADTIDRQLKEQAEATAATGAPNPIP